MTATIHGGLIAYARAHYLRTLADGDTHWSFVQRLYDETGIPIEEIEASITEAIEGEQRSSFAIVCNLDEDDIVRPLVSSYDLATGNILSVHGQGATLVVEVLSKVGKRSESYHAPECGVGGNQHAPDPLDSERDYVWWEAMRLLHGIDEEPARTPKEIAARYRSQPDVVEEHAAMFRKLCAQELEELQMTPEDEKAVRMVIIDGQGVDATGQALGFGAQRVRSLLGSVVDSMQRSDEELNPVKASKPEITAGQRMGILAAYPDVRSIEERHALAGEYGVTIQQMYNIASRGGVTSTKPTRDEMRASVAYFHTRAPLEERAAMLDAQDVTRDRARVNARTIEEKNAVSGFILVQCHDIVERTPAASPMLTPSDELEALIGEQVTMKFADGDVKAVVRMVHEPKPAI